MPSGRGQPRCSAHFCLMSSRWSWMRSSARESSLTFNPTDSRSSTAGSDLRHQPSLPERFGCRRAGEDLNKGLGVRPNPTELDKYGTVTGQNLTSSHSTKPDAFTGETAKTPGFCRFDDKDYFRPHNPLVVCSNHTGPSFVWCRDFSRGWLFRWCEGSTAGSVESSLALACKAGLS